MISLCRSCKRCENEVEYIALSTVSKTGRTFCHPNDMSVRVHDAPVTDCGAYDPRHTTLERWFS